MARGLHVLLRVQRLDSAATAPTIALRSVCCWLDVSPTIILRAEAELLLEWAARLAQLLCGMRCQPHWLLVL